MCGIAGFIDFKFSSQEENLQKMTDVLFHRGPNGGSYYWHQSASAQIGLGHRRLSIIDLSSQASQPMHYKHFSIVFNGEIYNFEAIKKELTTLGHQFETQSDTEVILHAYEEWGDKCLSLFIGMFAFVIYDAKKQNVFCARDRAGVKPFFYYWHNHLFLFASELKAFHEHPLFEKKIDLDAAAAFVQYGNIPTPYSIFENTLKLKPGHALLVDLVSKKIEEKKYWDVVDFYLKPKNTDITFEEAKKATEEILQTAFQYRMVADVPVGVFLSGGYDSTALTSILQKNSSTPLKTFTIGVPDIGLNEAPFAKEIAQYLGTEHQEFNCTEKEALETIRELPFYFDEPFADSSAIPTLLVSRMAQKEVTVALSADGGDEIFAGYNRYDYLQKMLPILQKTPLFISKSVAGIMNMIAAEQIPVLKNKYNFHNRYEKLKNILKNPNEKSIMKSLSEQFTEQNWEKMFKNKPSSLQNTYYDINPNLHFGSALAYMQCIDYKTYMLDDVLTKVDRASMAASLEAREPFLDQHIIEFAATLPDHFKYNNGNKKYILKEIVHQYVPKSMMDRPKMGFAIPIEKWLLTDLKPIVEEYINENTLSQQNIFEPTAVLAIKNKFYSGKKEYGAKIWYFLMFQMWYEKWMK